MPSVTISGQRVLETPSQDTEIDFLALAGWSKESSMLENAHPVLPRVIFESWPVADEAGRWLEIEIHQVAGACVGVYDSLKSELRKARRMEPDHPQ
jgi:hypothetical protein